MIYLFLLSISLVGALIYELHLLSKKEAEYRLLLKSRTLEEFKDATAPKPREEAPKPEDHLVPMDEALSGMDNKDIKQAFKPSINDNE